MGPRMPVFGSPARPLRILQVTPQYAPSVGGVENHVRQVSTRLLAEGFHVEVLTADQDWPSLRSSLWTA